MFRRHFLVWMTLVAILMVASVTFVVFLRPNLLGNKPDFQLQPDSSSQTLMAGCHYGGTTLLSGCINGSVSKIMVQSLDGFSGIVTLTAATPANVNATITGYEAKPLAILGSNLNDTLFLGISAGVAGNFTLAITGTSGQLSHTVRVSIVAQDMTFHDNLDPLNVPQSSRANITITMRSVNGFHGDLTLQGGSVPPWSPQGTDEVLLFSPTANCSVCSGNPPPYPLLPGGTVQVVVMVTWQASDSGMTVSYELSAYVPALNGYFSHSFTIVFA